MGYVGMFRMFTVVSLQDKSTSSKRKRKGKKDKNAPKNARSAYTYYVEAVSLLNPKF